MAIIELPLRNDVDAFEYRITLDGAVFVLSFAWNIRDERWFISIFNSSREQIATSPLLLNADLFSRFKLNSAPQGVMFLVDAAGETRECERDELGTRCKFLYSEFEA